MCKCDPRCKTPFCGKGDCQWPPPTNDVYAGSAKYADAQAITEKAEELTAGSVHGIVKPEDVYANYGSTMHPNLRLHFDESGTPLAINGDLTLKGWYCPNCTKTHSPYVTSCPNEK